MKKLPVLPCLLASALCALPRVPLRAAGNAAQAVTPDYNIIMIVVDCLRADHLSSYGYYRNTSPNIDALAGGAAVFRQAVAQAPTTLLSFASMFTSRNVPAHGVNALDKALSDSALTLAEILRIHNYKTAAFMGGLLLNPLFKLDQGFDAYYHLNYTTASFKDTLPAALGWAKERNGRQEKFFLVAHGNDLHTPYVFPASSLYDRGFKANRRLKSIPEAESRVFAVYKRKLLLKKAGEVIKLSDDDVNHIVARYDEGIRYADGLIGDFLRGLRSEKLLDRTILILTADHGEGLFDHDYFFHDFNLYDDTLRVPLIIKVPGTGKKEIARQVRLIDLMPTLLELAGIGPARDARGSSFKSLLSGEGADPEAGRAAFSESSVGGKAIRSGGWKLIWSAKKTELYYLKKDPGERDDLAGTEKETAEALKKALLDGLAADEKDALSEALPSGAGFTAAMARTDAEQRELYEKLPGCGDTRMAPR
ncbi:MAG: sulfatase [Elusimicrobia bacterium]|nr:sulfatase [Elusimicrobiota bacterium]